jgi:hypothetical protein
MRYRTEKESLFGEIAAWNEFLGRQVRLIACGGTALTLLGVKDSTKDVDLMVPDEGEYDYLLNILKRLGYTSVTGAGWARGNSFVFDLFRGNRIHTTELLESPLKDGNHILLKEYSKIYLGILNFYDLIISKLFRATSVDFDDCLMLVKAKRHEIHLGRLHERYRRTALYDITQKKVMRNYESFIKLLKKEGLCNDDTITSGKSQQDGVSPFGDRRSG